MFEDLINLPMKGFKNDKEYVSTLLRELGHWSGHPQRLKRYKIGKLSETQKAKEELIVEIGSAAFRGRLNLDKTNVTISEDNRKLTPQWIDLIKSSPVEILDITAKAYKIYEYLKKFDPIKEYRKAEPLPLPKDLRDELEDLFTRFGQRNLLSNNSQLVADRIKHLNALNKENSRSSFIRTKS